MNYWTKKNEMKRKAVEHTKEMMETHKDEIKHSIEATRTYGPEIDLVNREEHPVEMIVEQADSVLAVLTKLSAAQAPSDFLNQGVIAASFFWFWMYFFIVSIDAPPELKIR